MFSRVYWFTRGPPTLQGATSSHLSRLPGSPTHNTQHRHHLVLYICVSVQLVLELHILVRLVVRGELQSRQLGRHFAKEGRPLWPLLG